MENKMNTPKEESKQQQDTTVVVNTERKPKRRKNRSKRRSSFRPVKRTIEWKKIFAGAAIGAVVAIFGTGGAVVASQNTTIPAATVEYRDEDPCETFEIPCEITEVFHNDIPRGSLVEQTPEAGWLPIAPESVELIYSKGNETNAMPDVVGLTPSEARKELYFAGLDINVVDFVKYDEAEPGTIISTSIETGVDTRYGQHVDLIVAGNIIDLPDWTGATKKQVEAEARDLGLTLIITHEESKEVPGVVLSQYPEAGEIQSGSEVNITIAKEFTEKDIKIPDVIGEGQKTAQSMLAEEGFRFISTVEVENTEVTEKQVTQVIPGVGQTVPSSTEVVIIVSIPTDG